ncbi:hypothetical protein NPIL_512811 [Nephila pilipes]|uniref:Uncharacterized protein n=1 Tax=Nephila pilipes TaxID=299642 RepID=A0A8X6QTQ2_NEPPI|nr:hypothetical protein NPIL_512811 [Nephila pilipes]
MYHFKFLFRVVFFVVNKKYIRIPRAQDDPGDVSKHQKEGQGDQCYCFQGGAFHLLIVDGPFCAQPESRNPQWSQEGEACEIPYEVPSIVTCFRLPTPLPETLQENDIKITLQTYCHQNTELNLW